MSILQFKCRLLSDVIMSQKAATEGSNSTLDFIPGGNFLGIVANKLYNEEDPGTLELFHNGNVRYGDAHPAHDSARTLRVPAAMYYPKLERPSDRCYINHAIDYDNGQIRKSMRKLQLKQCRSGFYDFTSAEAVEVKTNKNFAIKSAHDSINRTSRDGYMYGYQSLEKGLELYFEVEIDDESFVKPVKEALEGIKRIGRSRSAQYGLVEISSSKFTVPSSCATDNDINIVYADSRLVFLDENTGLPTLRPTGDDLGIKGGKVLWKKSQVRTFQYSPWNFQRQCFDADRCGFEKGSVFVVKGGICPDISKYIGSFNVEGFGKVIYNPEFLESDSNGLAKYKLIQVEAQEKAKVNLTTSESRLVRFLISRKDKENTEQAIYDLVNRQVAAFEKYGMFRGNEFASQWGTIRSMATLSGQDLKDRLFAKETGYLAHGIASEKWSKKKRRDALLGFIEDIESRYPENVNVLRMAVINLAAEMAKRSDNKEDK